MDGEPHDPADALERYLIRLTTLTLEELLAIDAAYRSAERSRTIDPGRALRTAEERPPGDSRVRGVRHQLVMPVRSLL